MINVNFYTISKRHNSSLLPPNSSGTYTCSFKDSVNCITPVLLLNYSGDFPYNYCSFTFCGKNRYYFINNVTSARNDLWEISCEIDTLATYRDSIIGSTAYVMYATNNYSPGLIDKRIPVIYNASKSTSSVQIFSNFYNASGYFIVTCVGENGGVDAWRLDGNSFHDLLDAIQDYQEQFDVEYPSNPEPSGDALQDIANYIMSFFTDALPALWQTVSNFFKQLTSFSSATECIRSCFWVPFAVTSLSTGEITLGGYHTGVTANRVADNISAEIGTINIPWQGSGWTNSSYCQELTMYLPFVGTVTLPISALVGYNSLTIRQCLSNKTGDIAFQVLAGDMTIGTYGGNASISVPIGSSNISPMAIANSLAAGVAAVESPSVTGALGGALAMVRNMFTPVTQSVGGISSAAGAGLQMEATITSVYYAIVEGAIASAAVRGCPAFKTMTIPNSGYVQTSDYKISVSGMLDAERDILQSLMDGGVYIE